MHLAAVPLLGWRKRKCPRMISLFLFQSMINNVIFCLFLATLLARETTGTASASSPFAAHYSEQASPAPRHCRPARPTTRGPESSLLYCHQGQHDGPRNNTAVQNKICDYGILLTVRQIN